MTALHFGRTQRFGPNAWHTLGKLECSGKVEVKNMPSDCYELGLIGHSLSGFYSVKGKGGQKIETIYCDFNKAPTEKGIPSFLFGLFLIFSFSGTKEDRDGFRGSNKRMQVSLRLNGNAVSYAAGAKYKKPPANRKPKCKTIKGCIARAVKKVVVFAVKTALNPNEFDYTFSLQATLNLKIGDQVAVYLDEGELKGGSFNHFNGFLLDEDLEI